MREIGRANLIGTTARELMARRDCVGRVLAVVKGAVYVIARSTFASLSANSAVKQSPKSNTEIASSHKTVLAMTDDEILWLAQNHVPMHPRAIRGDFDFGALDVGMTFQSEGACLRFDNQSTLQFLDACAWQPQTIDPGCVVPREVLIARIKDLIGFLKPVRSDLHSLIGLGQGLTPSGDDFIGGLLFAQWYLYKAYPETITWDQRAVDDLIEYARTRTNVISHAILRDHASGKGAEPLHNLVTALLQGKAPDELAAHIRALLAIGSTSGWDMLVGVMTSMLLLESTH